MNFIYSVTTNLAWCYACCQEAQSGNEKNRKEEQKVHHFNTSSGFAQEILLYLPETRISSGKRASLFIARAVFFV